MLTEGALEEVTVRYEPDAGDDVAGEGDGDEAGVNVAVDDELGDMPAAAAAAAAW